MSYAPQSEPVSDVTGKSSIRDFYGSVDVLAQTLTSTLSALSFLGLHRRNTTAERAGYALLLNGSSVRR